MGCLAKLLIACGASAELNPTTQNSVSVEARKHSAAVAVSQARVLRMARCLA
jgi:hypothetical protein